MKRLALFVFLSLSLLSPKAEAADLMIAQAANFMPAMKEIIPAFERATGIQAQATYASTGKLYGQIINGAPFDIFLAADTRRPNRLAEDGLALAPFVYARGRLVLWTRNEKLAAMDWRDALLALPDAKIAIANTETAPYGQAAMEAMRSAGIWEEVRPLLVYGQTISQVFQYAYSGAADAGLCAYSSTFTDKGKEGRFIMIEDAPPVIQSACVLKNAPNPDAAAAFARFLATDEVTAIKRKYGYR